MMERRNLYTALIGVCGVLFTLTAVQTDYSPATQYVLGMFGALVFLWSALTLYHHGKDPMQGKYIQEPNGKFSLSLSRRITKVNLLNDDNSVIATWDLYQKSGAVIGRDYKENQVDIDLGKSEYRAMVDIHHAVLNYAEGNWYVEDLGSKNGVAVQKASDGRKYKLSSGEPCKLAMGDVLFIGMCRLQLN